jgi:arylsulfatase A-like enzyme
MKAKNYSRRVFLKGAGLNMAALAVPRWLKGANEPGNKKPNILFIFSDQQRWDTVSCYESPLIANHTPNLDKMAREGVLFKYSFTCQPVCGPARSCLQTGKFATETGCFRNAIALPANETTIAHRLAAVGYEVGYLGKWHLASTYGVAGKEDIDFGTKPTPPEYRGGYKDFWLASDILECTSHSYDGYMFDGNMQKRQFPPGRYRADAQTDWALEYLRTRKGDNPFLLFLSYIEPHHQNDHNHFEGPSGSKERFKNYKIPGDLTGTQGDWEKELADYLGCCGSLDDNVGRILNELEKPGMANNTLVIYTSDHACHFKTRNSEYKRSCHDNAIRTPLIIRGPDFLGGKVVNELVSLIDLPKTILKAGGARLPSDLRGRPLQELMKGNAKDWPQDVFVQISESQVGRALRTKKWKYSVRAPEKDGTKCPDSDCYVEDFLYDLENDPHERNNLVSDPALKSIRAELADRLKKRMLSAGEKEPEINPEKV